PRPDNTLARQEHDPGLGFDPGAASAARHFAGMLSAPLMLSNVSTQFIDVSRSRGHSRRIGPIAKKLEASLREKLLHQHYDQYRQRLLDAVRFCIRDAGYVIHLSVRTFAAKRKDGSPRRTDVGLLYDPSREEERELSIDLVDELWYELPMLRVRRNYPSRGTIDSIHRYLRDQFADDEYIGIAMHLNRNWLNRNLPISETVLTRFAKTIVRMCTAS
ncbi:MAG: hypothetical protein AAFP69_13265, partial [Planctomycetota bacterium]